MGRHGPGRGGPGQHRPPPLDAPGTAYTGLRFARGLGPAHLGVPADELRDRTPHLDELWPARTAAALGARVAEDPPAAMQRWLAGRAVSPDPLGAPVFAWASRGVAVAAMAERLGVGVRRLHRRSHAVFGYGPRHLSRVLRVSRAVTDARAGTPLAAVAADHGFTDQPHLCREVAALCGHSPTALLARLATRGGEDQLNGANRSTPTPSGSCTTT